MDRIPLYYTFGNHMHWVDMQWLWGYHVLPGSIRDMLHFCRETGAKGNVNFDGIGYEKLAAEDPEALAELREAVQSGVIEPVGCSYGQPYGLFHGGESNLRQRIYGARTVRRLLGVWPKTFWEEEFDFFPQLPQLLKGCGFEFASLFFQWTWHTPEVPKEDVPVVWWEGQDGSRLLCATRNKLNLHQWPEDMDATFAELAANPPTTSGQQPIPLILQWLELMPSPDWMCRSEVLLPKMKELLADKRFEIRMATLGEYLSQSSEGIPTRRYSMDDVWHGMSLGKNGDNIRRLSHTVESALLSAETLSAMNGLLGRPYAQWDVYPTWELEEAWRELLSAQHHDNDECEGLCGHVGRFSYERGNEIASRVGRSNLRALAKHLGTDEPNLGLVGGFDFRGIHADTVDGRPGREAEDRQVSLEPLMLYFNPLGWSRKVVLREVKGAPEPNEIEVPPFGFVTQRLPKAEPPNLEDMQLKPRPTMREFDGLQVEEDPELGAIKQITSPDFPEGALTGQGAGGATVTRGGEQTPVLPWRWVVEEDPSKSRQVKPSPDELRVWVHPEPGKAAAILDFHGEIYRPDPGMKSGLFTEFHTSFNYRILTDQPYGVSDVKATGKRLKKYPTGDWMTSPQWFEEIEGAFSALTFVDLIDVDNPDRGLLIVHNGSQQWFRDKDSNALRCLLNMYDPWDENYFQGDLSARFLLVPHGPMTNAERWKIAQEFLRPVYRVLLDDKSPAGKEFSTLSCDKTNVVPTAFYRETEDYSGKHVDGYAGKGMEYPYVLRLVEFDGLETEATLTVAGTVAKAFKTNHLGQIVEELQPAQMKVTLQPYEIATVYLDIVEGRKQTRDLDAKREIWATVHRVD
jgi:alpha-mannosidase